MIKGSSTQQKFLRCLVNMDSIIDNRNIDVSMKDRGSLIAFHLINKRAIAAIQKDDVVDMLSEMSFDDALAIAEWEKIKTDVLDSLPTDDLYMKTCTLFKAEPVDSLEFEALFNGPCFKSLTGTGSPAQFKKEPLASIINFALYTAE